MIALLTPVWPAHGRVAHGLGDAQSMQCRPSKPLVARARLSFGCWKSQNARCAPVFV